jgi:hypothetical protein
MVGSFKRGVAENGRPFLEVSHARMKNQQANAANAQKEPHRQRIFQHDNPKICAVAAYDRQVKWLGDSAKEDSPLFRSLSRLTKKVPEEPAKYASCKGVAAWVSQNVRPGMSFKDCARRAVISKLANDPRMTTSSVANFVHMTERNVAKYYRSNTGQRNLAAEVLAQVEGHLLLLHHRPASLSHRDRRPLPL